MNIFRVLLLLLLMLPLAASASVDSLIHRLEQLPNDTSRLPTLQALIRNYVFSKPDSALIFAQEYRRIGRAEGSKYEEAKGLNFIGMSGAMSSDHEMAMINYMKALELFEIVGDLWYIGMMHNNIGSIHHEENDHYQAELQFRKALEYFQQDGDTAWMTNAASNLGSTYSLQRDFTKAEELLRYSATTQEKAGLLEYAASSYMNLGTMFYEIENYEEAERSIRKAFRLGPVLYEQIRGETYLGSLLGIRGENDSALTLMQGALQKAKDAGLQDAIANANEALSDHFQRIGDLAQALQYFKAFKATEDSIYSLEKSGQIAELQQKYDSEKKDLEIEKSRSIAQRRQLLLYASLFGLILLTIGGIFMFRAYRANRLSKLKLEHQNKIIERTLSEKDLLLKEIHHRVKNNLQVISSLLSLQSRRIKDKAALEAVNSSRNRVKSMALIHQDLYKKDNLRGIDLPDYVEKLGQSLLSSYKVDQQVVLLTNVQDLNLDVDTSIPLGLILNELVTNSLKYAFPDGRAGRVEINLHEKDGELILEVRDNGVGYDPGAGRGEESTSFGFNMINSFSKKLKAEWVVKNEGGTVVEMKIRNYKKAS